MLEFKKEESLDNEITRLTKITKYISILRLIIALVLIVFLVSLISLKDYLLYGILSLSTLIVMISFILLTNRFYNSLELKKRKKYVYMLHKKRRNKEYSFFKDTGSDFIDKNDYKELDLDLLGTNSLYQYLAVAKTKKGRTLLAHQLKDPNKMPKSFTLAINEMANNEDVLDIEASLYSFDSKAKSVDYDEFLSVKEQIKIKYFDFLPLLSFILTILYLILIFTIKLNPYGIIIPIFLNFISTRIIKRHPIMHLNAIEYYNLCDSYINTINVINTVKIENDYYNNLISQINEEMPKLLSLKSAYSLLSSRSNIIFLIILNALFSFDFWVLLLMKRRTKSIETINKIFDNVAQVEVMLSFANIGIDQEVYVVPEESNNFIIKDAYHPLVKNCIPNDLDFNKGIILTGSNMSGKTTFMRTIGINQVLYNAGSIVCASYFSSRNIKVLTSLRANDMLQEGISTFYAEIIRMKTINQAIKENKCLILIDEIFKGTNAYERISASFKIIEKLNEAGSLFIISTHDFELCDAAGIMNYHFNESYLDNKISFDYKIKEGKCESKNALYLLKMADII